MGLLLFPCWLFKKQRWDRHHRAAPAGGPCDVCPKEKNGRGWVRQLDFVYQVINGLHVGSIYALVALGYSMVYGIVQLINFAHGDLIMVGSYAAYVVLVMLELPLWVAVLGSIVVCVVVAVLMERIAYRRLLNHGVARISLLITAIGVSIFLQNLAQLIFSSSAKTFPSIITAEPVTLGSMQLSVTTIITIVVSVVMMVLLQLLVNRTRMGKAMRAVSEDAGAAKLMGIHTNRTIMFTFGLGAALAAVGAVLYSASVSYTHLDVYKRQQQPYRRSAHAKARYRCRYRTPCPADSAG